MLNKLFSAWDELCERYDIEKIKTIGDCYMCVTGAPRRCLDHAEKMMEFAVEMLRYIEEFNKDSAVPISIRIGINSGPVIAGVLGNKKMCYDLWGDAVNVASRMESTGVPGRIQVSDATHALLTHSDWLFEERGRVEVKGKGQMLTYLFKDRKVFRTASGRMHVRAAITPPSVAKRRVQSRSNSLLDEGAAVQPRQAASLIDAPSRSNETLQPSMSVELHELLAKVNSKTD
eukprot:TRINITY_DN14545_c0_g1_i1.p2 TRINITY_DN14545_c0_g1~~TRINITY_DN14545_c0_g1_i1.p2  ORF type:complete len:231 (-),score=61.56 TRINITY_DN14545_c0_g1_i1:16-708(-)